jgi:hypothetical protein
MKEKELWAAGRAKASSPEEKPPSTETCSDWFHRYFDYAETGEVGKKNRGRPQVSVGDRRDRFENWLEPLIGDMAMSAVNAERLRAVVKTLDDEVRARIRFYEEGEGAVRVERGGRCAGRASPRRLRATSGPRSRAASRRR